MIKIEKGMLTEEQKRAFQRGDKYYVSPLKQYVRAYHAVEFMATAPGYVKSSYEEIHAANRDRINSRSWN